MPLSRLSNRARGVEDYYSGEVSATMPLSRLSNEQTAKASAARAGVSATMPLSRLSNRTPAEKLRAAYYVSATMPLSRLSNSLAQTPYAISRGRDLASAGILLFISESLTFDLSHRSIEITPSNQQVM